MENNIRPLQYFWIGVFVVAVVLIAIFTLNPPYQFRGSMIDPPVPAPEIELTDSNGQPFSLEAYRGKIVLLFFGYASCPDVCPTTLADLKQVRNLLEEQADSVQVVFVTLDPDRDTPEKLQAYVSLFDPTFIGLTGSMEDLEPIWDAYGVLREIDTTTVTAAGYLVNHSARTYLIDPEGNLHMTFIYGALSEDIASDIEHLLK